MSKVATNDTHSARPMGTTRWILGFVSRAPQYAIGILFFSLAVNLLLLVSPLYMLQIYDRVLSSGSVDTLLWLSIIAVFLLGIYSAAEAGRRRLLSLAGDHIERKYSRRIFTRFERGDDAAPKLPADIVGLNRIQSLTQSGAMLAFFDLPFTPFFVALLYLLDPVLGHVGVGGAIMVFIVAVVSERLTRGATESAAQATTEAQTLAQGIARQRSAIVAMGLTSQLYDQWSETRDRANEQALAAARGEGTFSSLARSLRQILQVLILGAGAALALSQQISPGGIVAGSVIMSRALAPIDQIVGAWRSLVMARTAWGDLIGRFDKSFEPKSYTPLPQPSAELVFDRLAISTPGTKLPLVRAFTYKADAGSMIALTGPNGAGKTTLLQTIAGAWPSSEGHVLLGGRNIHDWPSEDRGQYVGYVPQDVELTPGTVAENIARFQPDRLEEVFEAARTTGAHDMIVGLPKGYDTLIGPGGIHLSAGQRQMIGLTRAFFGDPVLLLLDEPTANLDANTAAAVALVIEQKAADGAIIVASTHDLNLIDRMTVALIIRNGSVLSLQASDYRSNADTPSSKPQLAEVAK
ncbi:MAG: ATP-binding cassette domain-containing protein [Pseudomonadota bacterium]